MSFWYLLFQYIAAIKFGKGKKKQESCQTSELEYRSFGPGSIQMGEGQARDTSFTTNGSNDINAFNCMIQNLSCKVMGKGNLFQTLVMFYI